MIAIEKSERAEIRVERSHYKGRTVVDIRVWWLPNGATEMVRSRKGVTFDEGHARELIEALQTECKR